MPISDRPDLLIRAGRVYTADQDDTVLRDAWVRVAEGRIAELSSSEPRAGGARVIDAPNATLVPGLIDAHVHLSLSGGPDWLNEIKQPYALSCWKAAAHARATLRAGFTTVRTLGGFDGMDVALRDARASGVLEAPRIVATNKVICITGGHGHWMGREADGPDEVRKAVREQAKAGADSVKFIATGGVMTPGVQPGASQMGYEELKAGVEEAHKAGKVTAAHAQGSRGIKDAVLAGIDSIEHGIYMTDEIVALMRERGTFFSATLVAPRGIAEAPANTVPEWARVKAVASVAPHQASFRLAYEAGVRMVLGTDAGTPFNVHGANARELSLMVKYAMQPLEALRAATRHGAELIGRLAELGSIEPGKLADVVLCDGDLTRDVDALLDPKNLKLVVQDGRVVSQ